MKLEPTGERMIVEHYHDSIESYVIYLMHIATYQFAEQYTRGKRVLDYGCGSGYGSARIASTAAHVQAVDVAEDAIEHAQREFRQPNLAFQPIDPDGPLPFAGNSFDTVLSFQVLEHVSNTQQYLAEVSRVLVPGGHLILVTPDRSSRLFPWQKPWNRWHLHEYGSRELFRLLRGVFGHVDMQHMSGRRDVIDVELRRYRKLKWLTLPATLPVTPTPLRLMMLNAVHALRGRQGQQQGPRKTFDFDESVISIGAGLAPSLNLVAIARK